MFSDFQDVSKYIEEQDIELVDLKYCDLSGRWHHVTLSAKHFDLSTISSGVGFDGSSVGLKTVKSGDLILIPDLTTGFIEPFWEKRGLSFICNIAEADTKLPFAGDPRQVAKRSEKYLQSSGIADSSTWGPEFEFNIFDNVSMYSNPTGVGYSFFSSEASWEKNNGFAIPRLSGYQSIPPMDSTNKLRNQMVSQLEKIGIPIKYHHHEVGSAGQCEIETPMLPLLDAADASLTIKYVTRMVAHENGKALTYLPKALFGEAGNGMHFHQQLIKARKNVFYEPEMPNNLSQLALYYIGGLLTHAPALLALTNPSTISYKRLVPGFEAPINSFFSIGNRSAAIRIPKYATQHDQVRIEFRPPDATCNPYLAIAAMLMAGLDGIYRKIDPTKAGFGPINEDIFTWSPERRATIKSLPTSLNEALRALEADHAFLLAGNVFNSDMIQSWISAKLQEIAELNTRPHPHEIAKYFDL